MNGMTTQKKQASSDQVNKSAVGQQKLPKKSNAPHHSYSGFPIQTKLTIGSPNDKYEREADAMADRIMRMPMSSASNKPLSAAGPAIQAKCAACEHEEEKIQRKPLMMKSEGGTPVATQALGAQLNNTKGSGSPLPPSTNNFMSQAFGTDFSKVRIHTGGSAEQMNQGLHARAFTHGSDIYFNKGQYEPGSSEGKRLLGHELTHVVQQNGGNSPAIQRLGDLSKVPPGMTCPVATNSPGSSGTSILFGLGGSDLSSADEATLSSVAAAWHAGGGSGILRIDGYASTDGKDDTNWTLSCDRAASVASELAAPTDGSPGVPAANLSLSAQGETSEFPGSLSQNRRAVITTTGGAPAPGPPCGLSIIGNNEVDHYCAAYVPSDAASCGTFPAPNLRLRAAGAAAGASLRWSIIRGNTNASIVGSSTNTAVDIKGDAASGAPGDVTVQVTDGTCTSRHLLTVREPTSMPASTVASSGPSFVQVLVTYTVQDQFGNPMGANICWDETVTTCANSHPGGAHAKGDIGTNASGQVTDRLRVGVASGTLPSTLCMKFNQIITAGGCGPLAQNTIVFQPSGASLNQGASCTSGDPCP